MPWIWLKEVKLTHVCAWCSSPPVLFPHINSSFTTSRPHCRVGLEICVKGWRRNKSPTVQVPWPAQIFEEAKYFDFKQTTVFCLGHSFSKHQTTRYAGNSGGGGNGSDWPRRRNRTSNSLVFGLFDSYLYRNKIVRVDLCAFAGLNHTLEILSLSRNKIQSLRHLSSSSIRDRPCTGQLSNLRFL